MRTLLSVVSAAAFVILASPISGERLDSPPEDSTLAACGHVGELESARVALEEGDREKAVVHLKNARELLAHCERLSRTEGVAVELDEVSL